MATPTAAELAKAFEMMGEAAARRAPSPLGTPSANDLIRFFQEIEARDGVRPGLGTAAETGQTAKKVGRLQRLMQGLRAWRGGQAVAGAVEATKAAAAAEVAAPAAAGAAEGWLARATGGLIVNKLALPRLKVALGVPAAAATAAGLGMNVGGNMAISEGQDDAIRLLKKYGMEVERGDPDGESRNAKLTDLYSWYTGFRPYQDPAGTLARAVNLEGDPDYTHPASDIDKLRVFTPGGEEVTGGNMSPASSAAQYKRESDLFRAAGLMNNKVRAERGLPPVYSPADLMRNAHLLRNAKK